jgi:hypothetical protein
MGEAHVSSTPRSSRVLHSRWFFTTLGVMSSLAHVVVDTAVLLRSVFAYRCGPFAVQIPTNIPRIPANSAAALVSVFGTFARMRGYSRFLKAIGANG